MLIIEDISTVPAARREAMCRYVEAVQNERDIIRPPAGTEAFPIGLDTFLLDPNYIGKVNGMMKGQYERAGIAVEPHVDFHLVRFSLKLGDEGPPHQLMWGMINSFNIEIDGESVRVGGPFYGSLLSNLLRMQETDLLERMLQMRATMQQTGDLNLSVHSMLSMDVAKQLANTAILEAADHFTGGVFIGLPNHWGDKDKFCASPTGEVFVDAGGVVLHGSDNTDQREGELLTYFPSSKRAPILTGKGDKSRQEQYMAFMDLMSWLMNLATFGLSREDTAYAAVEDRVEVDNVRLFSELLALLAENNHTPNLMDAVVQGCDTGLGRAR